MPVSAPLLFTANDGLDFGVDLGSPVGIEYYDQAPFRFNGRIEQAQVKYLGTPAELQKENLLTNGPIPFRTEAAAVTVSAGVFADPIGPKSNRLATGILVIR